MNFAIKAVFSCAAILGIAASGCAADNATHTTDDDVVVGVSADLADHVSVYADRLEFDAELLPQLRTNLTKVDTYAKSTDKTAVEPVYFVGNRASDALNADGSVKDGARNGKGYLRRATSWTQGEGGKIIVSTEPATLAEAIEEVKKNGFSELKPSSVHTLDTGATGATGATGDTNVTNYVTGHFDETLNHTFGNTPDGFIPIDLSGKVLWQKQLWTGGQAKVTLKKGKITIKPTLDAHILIDHFIPQNGHVTLQTDVAGELEFEASAEGAFEVDRGDTIFNQTWGTVVGGVPVSLTVDVSWKCGLGINGSAVASIGATATGSLRAGAEFDGFHVNGILDKPTYTFNRLGPTFSAKVNLNGRCDLVTVASVQLFDAAGPQGTVDLYAALAANASASLTGAQAQASLKAGVEASVGGSLKPFGITIAQINAPPFTYEKEIFNGAISIGQP